MIFHEAWEPWGICSNLMNTVNQPSVIDSKTYIQGSMSLASVLSARIQSVVEPDTASAVDSRPGRHSAATQINTSLKQDN